MIEAGTTTQVMWGDGNWVFLDIGFSRDARSCGLLVGSREPDRIRFSEAALRVVSLAKATRSPMNLLIEAPLSVCFTAEGNPKGRSLEREDGKTRYWHNGLGCLVMVATMYLVRALWRAQIPGTVRLFEGFVSYKDQSVPSNHKRDVLLLREVVQDPVKFGDCIFAAERLRQDPSDKLLSAFSVADMDCGIPTVIKR